MILLEGEKGRQILLDKVKHTQNGKMFDEKLGLEIAYYEKITSFV